MAGNGKVFLSRFLFVGFLPVVLLIFINTQRRAKEIPFEAPIPITITPQSKLSPTPTTIASKYPIRKRIYATMFWVGEKATNANDYIPNMSSAWDNEWLEHFGGIDNPYSRNKYYPKGFIPKENPFYIALPYDDFGEQGRKQSVTSIPWFNTTSSENYSFLKNRWVKLMYKGETCFAQWEDVGPFETDDFEYVFGRERPKSNRAGIDLSPAVRRCLKMVTNDYIDWQFVDEEEVIDGPWKEIITSSQTNW